MGICVSLSELPDVRHSRQPESDNAGLAEGAGQHEVAMFSRPTETGPFGKSTARIDIPCAGSFKDALRQLASLEGLTEAAYARRVLETHVILERERLTRMVEHLGGAVTWRNLPDGP